LTSLLVLLKISMHLHTHYVDLSPFLHRKEERKGRKKRVYICPDTDGGSNAMTGQDLSRTHVVLCAVFLIHLFRTTRYVWISICIYITLIFLSFYYPAGERGKKGEKRVNEYIRRVVWVGCIIQGRYRPCCPSGTAHDWPRPAGQPASVVRQRSSQAARFNVTNSLICLFQKKKDFDLS
jgi:hypothetical protein